jgi:hypothetical protein
MRTNAHESAPSQSPWASALAEAVSDGALSADAAIAMLDRARFEDLAIMRASALRGGAELRSRLRLGTSDLAPPTGSGPEPGPVQLPGPASDSSAAHADGEPPVKRKRGRPRKTAFVDELMAKRGSGEVLRLREAILSAAMQTGDDGGGSL